MEANCKRKVLFISQLCYFRHNDKYRLERSPSQFGYKRKWGGSRQRTAPSFPLTDAELYISPHNSIAIVCVYEHTLK